VSSFFVLLGLCLFDLLLLLLLVVAFAAGA